MSISDHEYVNFSEDHELNYHLRDVNKQQSEVNRNMLRVMGVELKGQLKVYFVTHAQFRAYINTQLHRLS
ncbi:MULTISPECIES: hypothetical protein [Serratia]|uniref:Uncharacterized protein n=1 Tax=Serratia quinivorans TaxID=137545 RepID=A0A379ZZD3_9GAMM|nr:MULTISPECIES: hypothetical protein [Serratia]RYM63274.1 hypothetical protein BSR03_08315 [Serratia proteamaculans]CAI1888539.1 Uncharacterised protein [Serratia quinivorans]SUI70122.1 Uncharacterised protein [Serratia quinivorans]